MIEKMKRVLKLGAKECLVCGKSFQPASGAQKTCSPECKAKARLEGLTKRGPRKRGGVDHALVVEDGGAGSAALDRVQEGPTAPPRSRRTSATVDAAPEAAPEAQEAGPKSTPPIQAVRSNGVSAAEPESEVPDMEIDLKPVEAWVKAVVRQSIRTEIREIVRQAVRDELAERLKGLFAK